MKKILAIWQVLGYTTIVLKNGTYESFIYGGIAQLARAHGSYPWCHGFKSLFRYYIVGIVYQMIKQYLFLLSKHIKFDTLTW